VLLNLNVKPTGMDGSYSQSLASTVVNPSLSVSGDGSPELVRGGGLTAFPRPNEEPTVTIPPLLARALAFFTMYSALCAACTREDFARVRTRLQLEWSFDGGFVSRYYVL